MINDKNIEKSLILLESLGFVSDEPDDNWRDHARFWDPDRKEHFIISLQLMNDLPALLKIIYSLKNKNYGSKIRT